MPFWLHSVGMSLNKGHMAEILQPAFFARGKFLNKGHMAEILGTAGIFRHALLLNSFFFPQARAFFISIPGNAFSKSSVYADFMRNKSV